MAQSPSRDQTTRKSVGSSHTNDGTRLKLKHVDNSGQDGLTETHDPNQNNNPSDAQKSYEQDDVMDNATSVSHTSTSSDDNEEDSDYEGRSPNSDPGKNSGKKSGKPKPSKAGTTQSKTSTRRKCDEPGGDAEKVEYWKNQARTAKAALTRSEKVTDSLRNQVANRIRDLAAAATKLKNVKQEYARKLRTGPITTDDDTQLRQKLNNLDKRCSGWAAIWARTPTDIANLTELEKARVLGFLQKQHEAVSPAGKNLVFFLKKSGEVLLNSVLTHMIWFDILERPLFFLERAKLLGGPEGLQDAVQWLVQRSAQGGKTRVASTYQWYSTLVKTLRPETTKEMNEGPGDGEVDEVEEDMKDVRAAGASYKKMKEDSFKLFVAALNCNAAQLLKVVPDEEAKKRDQKLVLILRSAADVSHSLWTQGYKVECQTLPKIEQPFAISSITVLAHPTMVLDVGDIRRDGEEIVLVSKPRVMASGNGRGEKFDLTRALDPATVCLATEAEIKEAVAKEKEIQDNRVQKFTDARAEPEGERVDNLLRACCPTFGNGDDNAAATRPKKRKLGEAGLQAGTSVEPLRFDPEYGSSNFNLQASTAPYGFSPCQTQFGAQIPIDFQNFAAREAGPSPFLVFVNPGTGGTQAFTKFVHAGSTAAVSPQAGEEAPLKAPCKKDQSKKVQPPASTGAEPEATDTGPVANRTRTQDKNTPDAGNSRSNDTFPQLFE